MIRKTALICAAAALLLQPLAAMAAAKDAAVQGYALPADKPVTVVLMRPDVDIGELQAGGLPQPNADWTNAARENIARAIRTELSVRNINFTMMDQHIPEYRTRVEAAVRAATCPPPPPPPRYPPVPAMTVPVCVPGPMPAVVDAEASVAEYSALHREVVQAILAHQYKMGDTALPSKRNRFAYTLGPGTSQLAEVSGANYGLFVLTYDQFASDSRKAMQVAGALGCLIGACMIVGGGVHVSYISLVELNTGNVVWFNLLRGSKGDVREAEGARSMVQAIMERMPTRPGELATAKPAKPQRQARQPRPPREPRQPRQPRQPRSTRQ